MSGKYLNLKLKLSNKYFSITDKAAMQLQTEVSNITVHSHYIF